MTSGVPPRAHSEASVGEQLFASFAAQLGFALDDFQIRGCEAIAAGRGVLVAAPTGAGKTVVGEFAVHVGLATGRKAFYTTPIKALSNQKYADLVRRYGAERVGLLTGDASINGEAPMVVMTTEVLRNMMYAGSPTLEGLGYVVMDEVHYLADRFRGAVWEEVIIHLPADVVVCSLSATVSNAEEFGDWLAEVRGAVDVVVSEHRPVPLWQHLMVGPTIYDLFAVDSRSQGPGQPADVRLDVNPELLERIRALERRTSLEGPPGPRRGGRGSGRQPGGQSRGGAGRSAATRGWAPGLGHRPGRSQVVQLLDQQGLLPAITFIFSRAGCEAAVGQLLAAQVRLIEDAAGEANRRYVEERVSALADEDLGVLGYWDFVDGLSRGFAAHHAGMLPTFREIVEELFTQGRIRAVFATETLALGINMPARTVVLERLVKFNGETHAELTPAEYTQLTGRAGRRGIDLEGHAVVAWSPGMDPVAVGGLASTRTYPLRSSFRPTSNMAVNLVGQVGRDRAREVLETSFAQFQADRAVVGLARAIQRHHRDLDELDVHVTCELGDFREYAAVRHEIRQVERDLAKARSASVRAEAALSVERLRVGDVIRIPTGRRAGYAVVVAVDRGRPGSPSLPAVVTEDRRLRRLTPVDVPVPVDALLTLRVPKSFNPKSPASRRDLAATLRATVATHQAAQARTKDRSEHHHEQHNEARGAASRPRARHPVDEAHVAAAERLEDLRHRLRAHPCHACPDREEHARWAERWWRLRRETDKLTSQAEGRTNTVARTFDRICALLAHLGYLTSDGRAVTEPGQTLRRIYTERDLLTAECLRLGVWNRLDAAGLAAAVSALVHEPRRDEAGVTPRLPTSDVQEALTAMTSRWAQLEEQERRHGLPDPGPPDAGIAWMVHRWASGQSLEVVLRDSDLAAGDFVRAGKQVADLLGQIADCAPHPALAGTARKAAAAVLRGVVAADRLD